MHKIIARIIESNRIESLNRPNCQGRGCFKAHNSSVIISYDILYVYSHIGIVGLYIIHIYL